MNESDVLNLVFSLIFSMGFAILGVLAHLSWRHTTVKWILYGLLSLYALGCGAFAVFFGFIFYFITVMNPSVLDKINASSPTVLTMAQMNQIGWFALVLLVVFLLTILVLVPKTRTWLFKLVSANPESPPHVLGVVVYLLVAGYFFLCLTVFYDKDLILREMEKTSLLSSVFFAAFVPILIITIGGVGLFVRRSWQKTRERLGLIPLNATQVGHCVLYSVAMLTVLLVVDSWIIRPIFPDAFALNAEFDQAMRLEGTVVEILFGCLVVAFCAGFGEELLFRGLLQPAFGMWPAAILFALMHVHYGPTILLGQIFVLGTAFGFIRKFYGTTGAMITHSSFDLIVLLLTSFHIFEQIDQWFMGG